MARRDYSDEEDYYSQGFEREGVASIWLSCSADDGDLETDVLQDLCGVGYYSLDSQEANARPTIVPLEELLGDISYSVSFLPNALSAARDRGLEFARWVVVQFDFAYDPTRVSRPIAADPIFLGVFSYEKG